METPVEEPQRPGQPDEGILAEASESEADESDIGQEPPTDDQYVPV